MPLPVIFDLDGVLVDSEPLYELAFRTYLEGAGRADAGELFALTLGRRQVDVLPALAARLDRPEAELERGLEQALAPLLERLRPLPFAGEAVRGLRRDGRVLALATSSLASFAERALRGLGLAQVFDAVVTGEEAARGKPDPSIYLLAASRLGVEPGACIAIEDTRAGVASATGAGMTCIAIPNSLSAASELGGADLVADDLRAATAEVRRLDREHAGTRAGPGAR